ncbi:transporter substrate-binding domain-containing protein [Pseudodesulfovibrio sediminis]|uniref:Solute-binding protein family 3/N-terminal domain-containing protein n=1 Tax=Pseudodesulfovibrio sediminis TaxID=2810563 RepID=A0ABN6ERF5_9BACT|nr:transporter substrate-binding domain-containing protein [Pseudodesulfovibrio sediminis]BCS88035.1 hypothetical protein PSDVSF_12770 [Pseudodesulfovibrio sediminis]
MIKRIILACLFFLVFVQPLAAQNHELLKVIVLFDRPLSPDTFLYRVLDLALKNQSIHYDLKIEAIQTSQPRRVEIVSASSKNYVIALGSGHKLEAQLQAVYVPIQLGLGLGQRIILTRMDLVDELKKVKTLDDLYGYVFGQGLGWTDVKIMRDANLQVLALAKPTNIPKMIMHGRVDLYPRGLFEIDLEYARYAPDNPGLVIDEHLVLSYPLASFFYVRKGNDKLYNALKSGLEKAYETGQLQDLVMTDPVLSKTLRNIHLDKRVKIEIPVNNASENTLNALKRFQFIPEKPIGQPVR